MRTARQHLWTRRHYLSLCLGLGLAGCARPAEQDTPTGAAKLAATSASVEHASIDASLYLDYQAGIDAGVYRWVASEDGSHYVLAALGDDGEPLVVHQDDPEASLTLEEIQTPGGVDVYQGVYMDAHVTNPLNQTMLIYVPAAYLATDADGNVTGIDHEAVVAGYTADTAPIIYANQCSAWRSSSPHMCEAAYIEQGMVYVSAGARSRGAQGPDGSYTGKAPTPIADLKAGVIALRANAKALPGDVERIVSVGRSGGGEMSSVLAATGNMEEYLPYLFEAGALGVSKAEDGSYTSAYRDDLFATQIYCPIIDLENSDLAFAWWWVDLADEGGFVGGSTTPFKERLQELEAEAFVSYLNSLDLHDSRGTALTLEGLRSGTYYDAILACLSDALNASVAAGETDPATAYPASDGWLSCDAEGLWHVTDLKGFMVGTGTVHRRGKDIPSFDALDKSSNNGAFGTSDEAAMHFSRRIAQLFKDHYDELSALEGFDATSVDAFIEEALTGPGAEGIATQTRLMNVTHILLESDSLTPVDVAPHWRIRSGTLDEHASFSIAYNLCLAARQQGATVDYSLVWDMLHSNEEGTTTGTLVDWVRSICP